MTFCYHSKCANHSDTTSLKLMPKTSRSSCTPKSQRNEPLGDWEQIWHIEQWILSMMKTKKSFSMRCILTAYMPSTCVEFNCSNNLFDLHNEPTLEKWSSCLLVIGQWALHPVLWLYQKTRALSTSHPSHSDGNQKSGINAPVEVGSLKSYHYLQGLGYIPGGCLGFLNHQQLRQFTA